MGNDPVYRHHHDMFMRFYDAETCELVDPDGLHSFCLASKLNADDCLSFKEILHLDKELQDQWFNAVACILQKLTTRLQKCDAEVLSLPGADSTIQTSQWLEQK